MKIEIPTNKICLTYQELRKYAVYYCDWYDWALSGVLFIGRPLYFKMVDDAFYQIGVDEDGEPDYTEQRIFGIYDCPQEFWTRKFEQINDFCKYVGRHWIVEDGRRKISYVPTGQEHLYYNKWKGVEIPLEDAWLIGKVDSEYSK